MNETERTGTWRPHSDPSNREWDVCTLCGIGCHRRSYGINPDGSEWVEEYSYRFCPFCGARMKENEVLR